MAENYFAVLGISPDASSDEVKDAYRRLAKRYHPDHEGGDSCTFRRVQEAYHALADPEQRRQYRHEGSGERVPVRVNRARSEQRAEPLRQRRARAEHIAPSWRRQRGSEARPGFQPVSEEMDELFDWMLRSFFR